VKDGEVELICVHTGEVYQYTLLDGYPVADMHELEALVGTEITDHYIRETAKNYGVFIRKTERKA
jgi:hypothetical protein